MTVPRQTGVVFLAAFIVLSHNSARAQSPHAAPAPTPAATSAAESPVAENPAVNFPAVNFKDADSILGIAVPRTLKNRRESMAYTYDVDYRNRNLTPRGKLLTDYAAKYEVIFVEGLPYRRLVEENHRPLSGLAAAQEAQHYDQTFAERSHMSLDQKRDYLRRPWNVDVPLPQIIGLFNSSIVGEDLVEGRPALVIESTPRPDAHPADEEERRALHKRVKLWIDREDLVASRIEATLVADDALMKSGTVARIDFERKAGVWLPIQSDVKFEAMADDQLVRGETLEENTGFRRFHVDVRLLDPNQTATGTTEAQ
jgi:hypothetical protein